jgi:predicted HAD superfamily hydrolase
MSIKVVSFDVFDTCLLRRCGAPAGVFADLAQDLQRKGLLGEGADEREEFIAARIRSESKAREKAGSEEVSLEQIWQQLCAEMGWDYLDKFCGLELDKETAALVANPDAARRVGAIRSQGLRLVFISDMYLPAVFIRAELERHGFFHEGDRLYVSSAAGVTKRSGKLFRHVLEQEGVEPGELRHLGDHPDADFKVPASLGIQAEHYLAAHPNAAENAAALCGAPLLGETMRRFRLAGSPHAPDLHAFVSDFAGPFICLFASWVLKAARAEGIRRLYFFSRDCQLVCKVAANLAPLHGDIECRYLKVSRQALFLPSAASPHPEEMPWMFRDFEVPSLESLLKKLELPVAEWSGHFVELHGGAGPGFLVTTSEQRKLFWQLLNRDPLLTVIRENIRQRREAATAYFQSEGVFDGTRSGVVDLGWFATCQMALVKILESGGGASDLHGFYLGLQTGRYGRAETGGKSAMFYRAPDDSAGHRLEKQAIFNRATLIEHLIGVADHASVRRYEPAVTGEAPGRYVPAYQGPAPDPDFVKPYHDLVMEFAGQLNEQDAIPHDEAVLKSALLGLSQSFWTYPRLPAVRSLAGLQSSSDQGGSRPVSVARPLDLVDIVALALPHARFLHRRAAGKTGYLWREGSLALSPTVAQRFMQILRTAKRFGSQPGDA